MREGRDLAFILRVLAITAEHDMCDDIWWRTDDEYAPVTFLVNCNDTFYWASADCEEITPENVEVFEKTIKECSVLPDSSMKYPIVYASILFCARVRKMRPQGACYKNYPEVMWPLLNACGEPREINFCNPTEAP